MIILETSRLILRRQVLADLDSLFELYSDPDVIKYIPDAPRSYQETREELEWHMHGHPRNPDLGLWGTIHKQTGQFIGRSGLLPFNSRRTNSPRSFGRRDEMATRQASDAHQGR